MRLIPNSKYRLAFLKHVACIAVAFSSVSAFALPSDRNQQLSLVADRAVSIILTSLINHFGNIGLIGLSISLDVKTDALDGLPSLFINLFPPIFPVA